MNYSEFLQRKINSDRPAGFEPVFMPDFLFDFQRDSVAWSCLLSRSAQFQDCGLGKSIQELVWAENVLRKTGKKVLILTPLAVSFQMVREGEKFGIECERSNSGAAKAGIIVTNYEQLHKFDSDDFGGVVCDESSILKSFDGAYRNEITRFMLRVPFRLLATATAAPNDYIELGTSSEALGYLGHIDMLNRFFKNDQNNSALRRMYGEAPKWRFKGHAEKPFWRWVTSWARAIRKPSDLGFDDGPFILPPLEEEKYLVDAQSAPPGMLFAMPATRLPEQREERKRTIKERCEKAAELATTDKPALIMCHMNEEGDLLQKLIPGCVQISGRDSDESKEEKFLSFLNGQSRALVTKPKIGAWGLNFQHCAHVVYFPSHSYEQYYQSVRRCWRFGQKNPVRVDIVYTEGEQKVMENQERKAIQADRMFNSLMASMNDSLHIKKINEFKTRGLVPAWL